jgi:hypothetical protein
MAPERPDPSADPAGIAIHGTAVAIAGRALILIGRSRSGKSALALALVGASTRANPIRLLGDDRILLIESPDGLMARPHPRIAGFIERRGLGIVAMRNVPQAFVGGIVALCGAEAPVPAIARPNFPWLSIVNCEVSTNERRDMVLAWWCRKELGASCASHLGSKRGHPSVSRAKD